MTGPYRLSRPTGQPSTVGIPLCYRTDADDDGTACALAFTPQMQADLLARFPSCSRCRAGMNAAKIYYAQRARP